jgi:hypothetical protein
VVADVSDADECDRLVDRAAAVLGGRRRHCSGSAATPRWRARGATSARTCSPPG